MLYRNGTTIHTEPALFVGQYTENNLLETLEEEYGTKIRQKTVNATMCRWVNGARRFEGTYRPHLQDV